MNRDLRERLLLPAAVPVSSALAIAFAVFAFSRVLLAAPKEVAVAVALMMAINILVVCGLVAYPPRGMRLNPILVIGAAIVPVVLGLAAASEVATKTDGEEAPVAPQLISIAAEGLAFDKTQLTVEAGRKTVIEFNNKEAVPHNVAVFSGPDASGTRVFTGDVVTGPTSVDYEVPALDAGGFFFRCDIHPALMTGTIVAEPKVAEPAESPVEAGPAKASVAAKGLLFITTSLSVPAGTAIDLEFDNQEAVPHNVAIFIGSDEKGTKVFTGDLFTGPRKTVYRIPALAEGNYFFRCDIHPATMKGSIKAA